MNGIPDKICFLDLETLGLGADAVVLSIGAIVVDLSKEWEQGAGPSYYQECNPFYQFDRNIDPATLDWWKTQPVEVRPKSLRAYLARNIFPELPSFKSALNSFYEYYIESEAQAICCNGTDFDISILKHAASQYDFTLPWRYNDVIDGRTIRNLTSSLAVPAYAEPLEKHNALDDAIWLAWEVYHRTRGIKKALALLESSGAGDGSGVSPQAQT